MFKKARLKLTAWYLAIIMLVSITFSAVIYRVLTNEVIRVARSQRIRIERLYFGPDISQNLPPTIYFDTDLLAETQRRLLFSLALINAGIVVLAASVGYFLAGKTLDPIQKMVDAQHQFISDASHELKTPITALKSSVEVYLRDTSPTLEEAHNLAAGSLEDINRLQVLSESLLTLSAYQQPLSQLVVAPTTPGAIIAKAMERTHAKAALRHIAIKTAGVSFAKRRMEGDEGKLTDMVIILLDNAIKYSRKGGAVNIKTRVTKNSVVIDIADNGIGIAPKDLPHIFDRFYRADQARTHAGEGGYGLGLSIALHIAHLHHGTLIAKSKIAKGTTFTATIPLVQPRVAKISSTFRIFSAVRSKVAAYVEKRFFHK